jgi:hypothetical protein
MSAARNASAMAIAMPWNAPTTVSGANTSSSAAQSHHAGPEAEALHHRREPEYVPAL